MTGAQRVAAELGHALVAPDTGPRSVRLPGDSESCDFGVAAAFTSTGIRQSRRS
jgi:S-formylglutathione hydrolase